MKRMILVMQFVTMLFASAQDTTFRWHLPSVADAAKITADVFPGTDAVILAKEQGFVEGPHTESIFTMTNEMTVTTHAIVVKLLNANAVGQFGSFSYEYPYFEDKLFQHLFEVKARIMKPDGTVWVMPGSNVTTTAGLLSGEGEPLTMKVMFKIPNLAPNDIVQIEYAHASPFSFERQILFFYHDRYPVLTSSVQITMTKQEHVNYLNFPANLFPARRDTDLGKSVASSWTLQNLPAIPSEPYGRPFAEVSYLTTIVKQVAEKDSNGWRPVAKNYFKNNLQKGSVSSSFIRTLGLEPSPDSASWSDVDRLYTSLRRYFRLRASIFPYTDYKNLDNQIDEKEASPSEAAFIMMKVLERWEVPVTPVLLRDRREGLYELTVPSLVWFDRLGLLVSWKGEQMLYDFDACIPSKYELPWFLTPMTMFAVSDTGGRHLKVNFPSNWRDHVSSETHYITLHPGKKAIDSVEFDLKGATAEELRGELYSTVGDALAKFARSYLEMNALQDADTSSINGFLDDPVIKISGEGNSRAAFATVDSFLTFQPKNHLIRQFRELFSSTQRHYDIFMRQPFAYSFSWHVHLPPGYDVARLPDPADIAGPAGVMAQVTCLCNNSDILIKADVLFNTTRVPLEKYAEWRSFLDNVNAAMEREVTLREK